MRFSALAFGLAVLLAPPALLVAQQHGAAPSAAAKEPAKAAAKPAAKKASSKAAKPKPTPAKELFGAAKTPSPLAARSIGFYAKGCLAGAAALPIDGPAWQAMRLSRNRNWGHPDLVALVEKLASEAKAHDGWPGLLVGDLSQPRGGPMLTGHASHQVGLDADVWLTPMPDHRLTEKEREELSATSMLADDRISVNPTVWTDAHVRLLKRTAGYKAVERVLVHPAIKKAVCEASKGEKDRVWLSKIRPYWGHYYHFHIRMACPKGSSGCEGQPSVNHDDDGCGAELTRWLKLVTPKPAPPVAAAPKPAPPAPERRGITLDQLPADCRTVLASGTPAPAPAAAATPAPAPAAAGAALGKAAGPEPTPAATPPPAPAPKPAAAPAATRPPEAAALGKAAGPAPPPKPAAAPAAPPASTKQAKPAAAKQVKPAPKKASLAE